MLMLKQKDLFWVSSSKKDLLKFPQAVQDEAIHALNLAKEGDTYHKAKPFKDFKSADVKEIVLDDRAGTFRVIYTIKIENAIYVLHAFQKKSKKGIKTTKQDVDLIHQRFQCVLAEHKKQTAKGGRK